MSWTAPAFLDEFAPRLEDRDGLAGVSVYRAPVDSLTAQENIVFVRITGDQVWAAVGGQTRTENYTVESSILITRTGAGDEVAKDARDRAQEILSEVVDEVQDLMTGDTASFSTAIGATQMTALNITNINLQQGANQSDERWAQVDFDLEVTTRIS